MTEPADAVVDRHLARVYRELIVPAITAIEQPVEVGQWATPGEPVPFAEASEQEYRPLRGGDPWGPPWGTTWLRVRGRIPEAWPAGAAIDLEVDLGFSRAGPGFQAEGLFWSTDGVPLAGIEPRNAALRLRDAAPGDTVDVYVEAASNPDVGGDWSFRPTRLGDRSTAGDEPLYRFGGARLLLLDPEVVALERDWFVLHDLLGVLDPESTRRARIREALWRAADLLDRDDVAGTAVSARAALAPELAAGTAAAVHEVSAVGHAHIDSAWLWPVRETVRKVARTFSNVLDLMDRHPEFVFAASSAQQYQWMRDDYPALFARIRERVAEGRWIAIGGMWVESDTNLPSGESMVRQFLEGAGFFAREFGVESDVVWLPDSFGYSGGLPQIMRGIGAIGFVTQKQSWNDTNRMPHNTFLWEGIDGSRILTHFPPVDTYNSDLSATDLARAERQHRERGRSDRSIVPFGYGDGGGGPTEQMIEAGIRKRDLDGSPRVRFESPRAFFDRVGEDLPDPAVWSGELYLEFHRGTYTSQARTKRGNRRNEALLHEAELWWATAAVRVGADYPADELRGLWQSILLGQFHDILPGSSIAWVHREAEQMHARVEARLEVLIADALGLLGVGAPGADAQVHANPAPVPIGGVPAFSVGPADPPADRVGERSPGGGARVSSPALRVEFDADGTLVSLFHLETGREYIAPGDRGNVLQLFRDTPTQWDAWDVEAFYERTPIKAGPAATVDLSGGEVRIRREIGGSVVKQVARLSPDGAALDLETRVQWNEPQRLLKLAFGFDIHAEHSASEIQFGHIQRPTHANTSWDTARFEISGHRWVRVADTTAGVTIANDRVYGRNVTRRTRSSGGTTTTVRETLLRAPTFPDPGADLGEHVFRHAIRPGSLEEGISEGYRLNRPARPAGAGGVDPLVSLAAPGALVETIKLADDGSGDVIVRIYESLGGRAHGRLEAGFPIALVRRVDLLERPLFETPDNSDPLELVLRAFEIVTLRLTPGITGRHKE